jgi:pimeloyl-ACP methyl ester carboxylesterase
MAPLPRLVALLLLVLLAGCTSLHQQMVRPPAPDDRLLAQADMLHEGIQAQRMELVTADGHTLSYVVLEPRDYGLEIQFESLDTQFRHGFRTGNPGPVQAPRGTVVLLHGWSMDSTSLLVWAMRLAELGYRSVALDLRNHGRSGAAPVGYGLREAQDVAALHAHLQTSGQLVEPAHLFGISMGAWASVVLIAPYRTAEEGMASAVRGLRDLPATTLRQRAARTALRIRYPDVSIERAIHRAGDLLELDLAAVDVGAAIATLPMCGLHFHGRNDLLIPVEQARAMAGALRVQYLELPDDGHFSVQARAGWLAEPLASWLSAAAADSVDDCPAFRLPPDPARLAP